ncbi:fructose-6-phosphate aldolase [Caloramator sp. E03]|uniref:fructose-6-phosphate aldolase n=1 Tax=Caloramator sp. E03 TaxID=2576307 RepID=UPI0011105739|nr:fructose-6-phosphate aldolase [Caloramator sp. E03]QCX33106.1 fructose-6-phosphate aldolase [Caloramator sp. E03]
MEFMFDTANIKDIKYFSQYYPITGVTSNPSIIKSVGKIDFFNHFKEIRNIIGIDKSLHIQVISQSYEGIMEEAEAILSNIDENVFIKVPVTENGLKAIRTLKARNISVTATTIYTKIQGLLAIESGADFIAPYFNRMESMDINPREVISAFAQIIEKHNYKTRILAASFKNISQVCTAFECGAHSVTLQPSLLNDALNMPAIKKAIDNFNDDWESIFGKGVTISNLK